MDVNAGGRLVRASEVQPKKAWLPMDVNAGGRLVRARGAAAEGTGADGRHAGWETHEGQRGAAAEASLPMDVTPGGRLVRASEVQPRRHGCRWMSMRAADS